MRIFIRSAVPGKPNEATEPTFGSTTASVVDAVASPRRRAILRLVWERELSAGEIAAQFDVSWPATSQNLQVLCDAGLLTQRKSGHHRLYQANHGAVGPLEPLLRAMWIADLDQLRLVVERERSP